MNVKTHFSNYNIIQYHNKWKIECVTNFGIKPSSHKIKQNLM